MELRKTILNEMLENKYEDAKQLMDAICTKYPEVDRVKIKIAIYSTISLLNVYSQYDWDREHFKLYNKELTP